MSDDDFDDEDDRGAPLVVPETYGELTFNQWLVRSGDYVVKDQPIASLLSDKVDIELEAPAEGLVVLREVSSDTTVRSGEVIARIEPPPPIDPALVARHDTLLAATVADPADNVLRQAYADFLLTANTWIPPWGARWVLQRGQYIDAQLQLLNATMFRYPATAVYRHMVEDCANVARDTARTLLGVPGWSEVEHGFVIGFTTTCATFVEHHARIRSRAALRSLGLSKLDAATVDQLVALPPLPFLRTLTLVGEREKVPQDLLVKITSSRTFAGLQKLVLEGFAFG